MKLALFYEGINAKTQFIGGSIYLMELHDRLRERGYVVSLLAPLRDKICIMTGERSHWAQFSCLTSAKPVKVLTLNKLILNSRKIFKSFDVVHTISWGSIPSLSLTSKYSSVPFIFDCRSSLFNVNRSYNLYKLTVLRLFKPSYLIFCDEGSFRQYTRIFGCGGAACIPTPVNTQHFKKSTHQEASEKFRILFASSLSREKGLLDLLQAVENLLPYHSDFELVVAGDGPLRNYITKLATEKVWLKYVGLVDHSKMPRLLNSVDLLVHPSYFEGLSHTVLEGLACGVPVITTDVGGHFVLKDVVRLIPPSSPKKISEEILYMLENEDVRERYSREGRRYVEENNSWNRAIREVIHIYESLLR
jgi:glycosyltransferase involved in cell wall biosynthesis